MNISLAKGLKPTYSRSVIAELTITPLKCAQELRFKMQLDDLSTVGYGTGALLARVIEKVEAVHWNEDLRIAQAM